MILTGEYEIVLDEKGRLMIPAKMRSEFGSDSLYITQGIESNHLMLLSNELFGQILNGIVGTDPLSFFNQNVRKLQRALIPRSVKVEFDSNGRITIPSRLRAFCNFELKDNLLVLGVGKYIEIWKQEEYEAYLNNMDESVSELSSLLFMENKESRR